MKLNNIFSIILLITSIQAYEKARNHLKKSHTKLKHKTHFTTKPYDQCERNYNTNIDKEMN